MENDDFYQVLEKQTVSFPWFSSVFASMRCMAPAWVAGKLNAASPGIKKDGRQRLQQEPVERRQNRGGRFQLRQMADAGQAAHLAGTDALVQCLSA